ncbi:MAG: glycoside hydrolase family 108 protein [Bacteroidota bacterium]
MADIESMLSDIVAREGGFVDLGADRGGATKYGITERELGVWLGHPASVADVQALDVDTAKAIYRKNYYLAPHIDQLPDLIQPVMLDAAVNSGPGQAVRWLQAVLNANNYGPLTEDGGIGAKTIAAASAAASAMGAALNTALIEARRAFLQHLAMNDPSQQEFEKGWMNRCDELQTQYCV